MNKKTNTRKSQINRVIISICPVAFALIIAFYGRTIISYTKSAIHFLKFDANETIKIILIILFWLAVLFWIGLYFKTIFDENDANKKNIEDNKDFLTQIKSELNSAIHNAPNPNIFDYFLIRLEAIYETIQLLDLRIKTEGPSTALYRSSINDILKEICNITKSFSGHVDTVYSANIMYYIYNNDKNRPFIITLKEKEENAVNWIYHKAIDIRYVKFVLHSISELNTHDSTLPYTPISLAGCTEHDKKTDIMIPGAPLAALNGLDLLNSTEVKEFAHLKPEIRDAAIEYFSNRGEEIQGLISMRIPKPGLPKGVVQNSPKLAILGVINIESDTTYPIGSEFGYSSTYYSLINPILIILAPVLESYFLLHPEIKNIDNKD